jgi:hypothetical protein
VNASPRLCLIPLLEARPPAPTLAQSILLSIVLLGEPLKNPRQILSLIEALPRLTEEQIRDFGDHGKPPILGWVTLLTSDIRFPVPHLLHPLHRHLGRRRNSAGHGLARVPRR